MVDRHAAARTVVRAGGHPRSTSRSTPVRDLPAIEKGAAADHQSMFIAPRLAVEISEHEALRGHGRHRFVVVPVFPDLLTPSMPTPGASATLRVLVELEQPGYLDELALARHVKVQVVDAERAAAGIDHAFQRTPYPGWSLCRQRASARRDDGPRGCVNARASSPRSAGAGCARSRRAPFQTHRHRGPESRPNESSSDDSPGSLADRTCRFASNSARLPAMRRCPRHAPYRRFARGRYARPAPFRSGCCT